MMRPRSLGSNGLLLIVTAIAGVGCTSTGVGNPGISSLQLAIVDDNADDDALDAGMTADGGGGSASADAGTPDATAGSAGDATAEQSLPQGAISNAIVVLGELRFQPCDATVGDVFRVPGPFVVNLKDKSTIPPIPPVDGTPGGYCGIDAPLAPATSPAALAGRSLFFDGYRADGTFFLLYANMTGTLRLRATPDATWLGMQTPPLFFWALRPRRWLAPAELNDADVMPYDTQQRAVVIDADRHAALYLAIRRRLAGVSTLYADANGDGIFDDGDRSAIVGQGLDNAD